MQTETPGKPLNEQESLSHSFVNSAYSMFHQAVGSQFPGQLRGLPGIIPLDWHIVMNRRNSGEIVCCPETV